MFFLSVCLFVTLWNYKVCDNRNAMKQYYYQNSYGVIACRKVCSCAPILNFSVGPKIFPRANLYQKLRFFPIFAAVGPHFLKPERWNLVWRCGPVDSLNQAKFCKNRLRGIPLLGKCIWKNTNFGDFGGCRPIFFKPLRWNLARGCGPGTPSLKPNLVKKIA